VLAILKGVDIWVILPEEKNLATTIILLIQLKNDGTVKISSGCSTIRYDHKRKP